MKIWFLEIGEPLPLESDERLHRVGMFSRFLAERGHKVTWWTSTFLHAKKKFIRESDGEETIQGVKLRLIHGPGYRRNVSFQRFQHQAHFARTFLEKASAEKDLPDLIVAPIPTLEGAEAAVRFGKERGIPVVVDIRDEWPEEFVDLAPKSLRWVARILLSRYFRMVRFACQNAVAITAMSERQLQYGLKYTGRDRGSMDRVFPLGYSEKPIEHSRVEQAKEWWKAQGVNGSVFTVCYFGTIGKFFNLETVIRSAETLSKEMPIQFVLCGVGGALDQYKRMADGVASVIFPGWVDAPKVAALMELSDIGLAPYSKGTRMSLPNKPFEYMAGGLPVVSSIQGELTSLLRDFSCGRTYNADSVEELCSILRDLALNPVGLASMGSRARRLFEEQFSMERIFSGLEEHLISMTRTSIRQPNQDDRLVKSRFVTDEERI